jgi:hypothetical protein
MGTPAYFRDDEAFIFSAIDPARFPGSLENEYDKKMKEMKSKYRGNRIYMLKKTDLDTLKPYVEFNDHSYYPLLNGDGSVLVFCAQVYKPDGTADWDRFFLYSPDGKHQRLTDLRARSINSAALSYDGKNLAIVYTPRGSDSQDDRCKIVIYGVHDGTRRDLALPDQPSRLINH